MTNNQYTEYVLSKVDHILLDTSSLMSQGWQQFVSNIRNSLIASGKKIIVPLSVYSELTRLLGSADQDKSESALKAAEVLCSNRDIFQVETACLTEEEIAHAFADAQLLSELTLHKGTSNQLLITNDKGLSSDAFEINQQLSCKGGRVFVCYINQFGEMQCCNCVKQDIEKRMDNLETSNNTVEKEPTVIKEKEKEKIKEKGNEWSYDWKSGAVSAFGFGLLYLLYKGGSTIIKIYK